MPVPSSAVATPAPASSLVLAGLGVLAFSFTFPATVLAERSFDAELVGAGRSVIAAVLAAGCLRALRVPLPAREHWPGLLAVAGGCGIGFGLLSALALRDTSSSHAAVVIGLLPAATALTAVVRVGDRPRASFWLACAVGTLAVIAYALARGSGALRPGDALLLAALGVGAVGYAEGGRLARSMPGWQVIAWGVLVALPVALPFTITALARAPVHHLEAPAVAGFAYVGVVSMFLGFFAWYRGLAGAGIARASQLQLAQPLLTIAWSAPLLGDRLDAAGLGTAVVVAVCVVVTQRSRPAPGPGPAAASPVCAADSAGRA